MDTRKTVARFARCLCFRSGCIYNQKQQIRIVIFCLIILFFLNMFGESPVIHQPCRIQDLDPWDKTMEPYITNQPPNRCANRSSLLYVDAVGILKFNTSAIRVYNLTSPRCEYQMVKRKGDLYVTFGKRTVFEPPVFVPCRVFRVICNAGGRTVYDLVHVNIAWNESEKMERNVGYESDDQLSVIYVGFDSVSGSEVIRKAPLTYNYLTKDLKAYHFRGSMKVGLNTYPNWIALLRGEYGNDLLFSHLMNKKFDDENFIWKDAKKLRYVTAFIDDVPQTAAFRGKFQKPPTDYFYRPFTLAMAATEPMIVDKLGNVTKRCYGNKDQFLLQLDYLKRFLMKYSNRRKFVFFWNNGLTHDAPNLEKGDRYMSDFLAWMKSNGHLDRAVLIIGSDHGFRIGGGASATYVGKLEMNMPALIVYFPKCLEANYPWIHRRLTENSQKLVTQYDVYETMKGVIRSDFKEQGDSVGSNTGKGRKLYAPISSQRSCSEAGIPPNFCTCREDMSLVDTSLSLINTMANNVIDKMNELMIRNKQMCVQLRLLNVTEARVSYKSEGNDVIYGFKEFYKWVFENDISGRYRVQFYTRPNSGLYQAVLDYDAHPPRGNENQITILGDPIRLNKYGNQSHCVDDSYLKQFCLCTDVNN